MTLSFTVLTSLFSVLSSGKNCYKNQLDMEGRTEQYAMYESLTVFPAPSDMIQTNITFEKKFQL